MLSEAKRRGIDEEINLRAEKGKVELGRGDRFGAEDGGWWRVVFSHPRDYLREGLLRAWKAVSK